MSRIGKQPVAITDDVKASFKGRVISIEGKLGELSWNVPAGISVAIEDGTIVVTCSSDEREVRSLHGLSRALIQNMMVGVSEGFAKTLFVQGVGYQAIIKGHSLLLNLGYSHPILFTPPEGISFAVPEAGKIIVSGIDKQLVGVVAAKIRSFRKPEPYKGKGIRYEGEQIKRKSGKSAVGAGGP